jgi:hypothetical protein
VEALDVGAALAGGATESEGEAKRAADGAASDAGTELADGDDVGPDVGPRSTVERHATLNAKTTAMVMIFMGLPR